MHEANGDGAGLGPSILPALARQLPHLHGPNHRGVLVVGFFFFSSPQKQRQLLGGSAGAKTKDQPFLFSLFLRAQVQIMNTQLSACSYARGCWHN